MSLSVIDDYIQLYKFTDYTNLSSIFGLDKQLYFKQGSTKEVHRVIDALFLFKQGIKPVWEDPCHQKGGIIQADVNLNGMEFINEFWDTLLTTLICGDIQDLEDITGIRVLNNLKGHNTL